MIRQQSVWTDHALDFLRGSTGFTRADRLAGYAVDHVRQVTGARFAEVVLAPQQGQDLVTLASSDPGITAELQRSRVEADDPPVPDRELAGSVITFGDLATDSPWPSFAALAAERTGVRAAVLAYAAFSSTALVMPVYDDRRDYFDGAGQSYVRLVSALTAAALERLAAQEASEHLRVGLDSRGRIGVAVGVLVARHGVEPEAAFDLLRQTSHRSHLKLRTVAERVIAVGDLEEAVPFR